GSLTQWLFTSRNRTPRISTEHRRIFNTSHTSIVQRRTRMSENVQQVELRAKTQLLLDGPLKHIRGAVLAAALLPLASVAAAPASAQSVCPSGGICGTVFNDVNKNGVQDAGDVGLENVNVTVSDSTGVIATVQTD